jgi:hypothetical protein
MTHGIGRKEEDPAHRMAQKSWTPCCAIGRCCLSFPPRESELDRAIDKGVVRGGLTCFGVHQSQMQLASYQSLHPCSGFSLVHDQGSRSRSLAVETPSGDGMASIGDHFVHVTECMQSQSCAMHASMALRMYVRA